MPSNCGRCRVGESRTVRGRQLEVKPDEFAFQLDVADGCVVVIVGLDVPTKEVQSLVEAVQRRAWVQVRPHSIQDLLPRCRRVWSCEQKAKHRRCAPSY